jgi:hypothetical protein
VASPPSQGVHLTEERFPFLAQRARAAFRAIALRRLADRFLARVLPPIAPVFCRSSWKSLWKSLCISAVVSFCSFRYSIKNNRLYSAIHSFDLPLRLGSVGFMAGEYAYDLSMSIAVHRTGRRCLGPFY